MKVAFCVPSLHGPTAPFVAALEASVPAVQAAGWEDCCVEERGNPYISAARSIMLRKALDASADVVVFLDYDLSWRPDDLVKLIGTEGEVAAGLYRFKKPEVQYMGVLEGDWPQVRASDGAIAGNRIPAGFMKITRDGVHRFMVAHPELTYGPRYNPSTDLFNHGVSDGVWYGEDYAFSRRWRNCGGEIWIVPDLDLTHHGAEPYPGNYHQFLMRQPGGSLAAPPDRTMPHVE